MGQNARGACAGRSRALLARCRGARAHCARAIGAHRRLRRLAFGSRHWCHLPLRQLRIRYHQCM